MQQLADLSALSPEQWRPLRRAEYDRLVEQGCFDDERVELLHGIIVTMSPQGPRHATVIERLNMLLAPAVLGRASVRVQSPLAASDDSEPEPDIAVVTPGPRPHGHPGSALLAIEVAQTSVTKDRRIKGGLYARAGVIEYWIVNLPENCVEIYTEIENDTYRQCRRAGRGDTITLQAFADITLRVDAFLD